MNPETKDLWKRAHRALKTARSLVNEDPDASASRAYYAAFYGVSAYFSSTGQHFRKHSGVMAAIHRELVNPGLVTTEIGKDYSKYGLQ